MKYNQNNGQVRASSSFAPPEIAGNQADNGRRYKVCRRLMCENAEHIYKHQNADG